MPNWCYNSLTVEAEGEWNEDPEVIEENQTQAQAELLKFKKENFKDNKKHEERRKKRKRERI